MGETVENERVVACGKGHVFTTSTERRWSGRYCPAPVFAGQCMEPLYDPTPAEETRP